MTSSRSQIHAHLQRQTQRAKENEGGQPRPARVRFAVKTSGIGESRLVGAAGINFGAYMLEEPTFSFGCVSLSALAVGELPLATATVLNWQLTSSGLWAGADLGFKVESQNYGIILKFTLTFEGSTMRTTVGTSGTGTLSAGKAANTYNGTVANSGSL